MSHIWSKEYDDKLRQRIKELEAERDRLEERLGDWQRETALAKADRDKLREALLRIEMNCISPTFVRQLLLLDKSISETAGVARQALNGE